MLISPRNTHYLGVNKNDNIHKNEIQQIKSLINKKLDFFGHLR